MFDGGGKPDGIKKMIFFCFFYRVPAAGPSNQKVTFFAFLDVRSLRVKMSEVF